jgi:hypothetical protein
MNRLFLQLSLAMSFFFGWFSWFAKAELQPDETLLFYPTYAAWDDTKQEWTINVHSCVYELEADSFKRQALILVLKKLLELDDADTEAALFKERARLFLVDHERGKQLSIKLNSHQESLPESPANGHILHQFKLPAINLAAPTSATAARWETIQPILSENDQRQLTGRIQLIAQQGVSIISDVDDTIKLSDVTKKKELIRNTFLKPFATVPGMSEQYQRWEQQGAVFHYLSASPWQLYLPLEEFRQQEKFPPGSWTLKYFRLTDSSFINLFKSQENYKTTQIKKIFAAFPKRQFVLIGDTGEQDPEIFAKLASEHPQQVAKILIRNSQAGDTSDSRFKKTFEKLDRERWQVFADPKELQDSLPAKLFQPK